MSDSRIGNERAWSPAYGTVRNVEATRQVARQPADGGASLEIAEQEPGLPPAFAMDGSVPRLRAPTFDPNALVAMLSSMQTALNSANIQSVKKSIEVSAQRQEALNKQSIHKMEEVFQKTQEAIAKQNEQRVANWVKAAFGMLGAALAFVALFMAGSLTSFSGGIGLIGAGVGVILAAMDLVNTALDEANVKIRGEDGRMKPVDVSIGGMVAAIVESQIKNNLISFENEEAKANWIAGWSIAANVMVLGLVAGSGIPGLRDAYKAIKQGQKLIEDGLAISLEKSKVIEMAIRHSATVAELGEGAAMIANGVLGIQTAYVQLDKEQRQALESFLRAMIQSEAQKGSAFMDLVNDAYKAMTESWQSTSDRMAEIGNTQVFVARNTA